MRLSGRDAWICAALALAVLAVYLPVRHFDFVDYDDSDYVFENPRVLNGLTWPGVAWAFRSREADNWHPLTWLSHMLDATLYGPNPGGHHMTNVILHAGSALLLYVFLRSSAGAMWPSVFAAALFGLHPLRVESVAWVAERKDVLCGFFSMLTLCLYGRYGRQPGPAKHLAVFASLALALLAKSMAVTLPFVLFLLDYWPLRRFSGDGDGLGVRGGRRVRFLALEKIPFLALSLFFCFVTLGVQRETGAVKTLAEFPLGVRLGNALEAYGAYLWQAIWPARLAVFYPHPGSLSWGRIAGATAVLAAGTALALATIRRRPWLAVGWAWYLGTLVPVIGLVQIGLQARADRYTYLPLTGVFVAAGWEFAHWASRGGGGRKGSAGKARAPMLALAIVLVAACAAQSRRQVMYWRDSLTLFRHAIEIAADNYVAHNNLGGALEKRGRYAEAAEHYRESLRLRGDAMAHYNLGGALAKMGRLDDAIGHWQEAIRLTPGFAKAYYNLGLAWELKGNPDLAAACYRTALKYDPLFVDASGNLGRILGRAGRLTEAEDCLRQAIRLAPGSAPAHVNLGNVLVMRGKTGEAAGHYREALRLDASLVPVRVELAWILASDPDAQNRNGAEAMRLAEAACPRGSEAPPRHLDVLAAAYAEAGRFALAVRAAEEARTRAAAAGQTNLAAAISARLDLYRAGSPFRWSDESNRSM